MHTPTLTQSELQCVLEALTLLVAEAAQGEEELILATARKLRYAPESDESGGDRLYRCLALFDTRDGSALADIVRAAREGWERSDMEGEPNAWDEFDARIAKYSEQTTVQVSPYGVLLTKGDHSLTMSHHRVLKVLVELAGPERVFEALRAEFEQTDSEED